MTALSRSVLIVFLGGNGRLAPIMWWLQRLNCVTKSHLASATMVLAEAAGAGCLTAAIVKEIFAISAPKVVLH